MTIIRGQDISDSIADALQYISYYHPPDFIKAMKHAYDKEQNPAAKDAIAQILINSRMSALGHRPLCQDTGIVNVFLKIGMQVTFDTNKTLQQLVDAGVRQAYNNPSNPLRASIVTDPADNRINTKDNTPSVVHMELVLGHNLEIIVAAKGGGSENKAKMAMLNPSDSIVDWVVDMLPAMGAGWCPPGILGIGIGGTIEKAALMAKESLMEAVDIQQLIAHGAKTTAERLRLAIMQRVNALGIGAQGLGGLTTVLDVKIKTAPTHAACKPVVMIPNCAATRHIRFCLDGQGPAQLAPPKMSDWPKIANIDQTNTRRINLDKLTKTEIAHWRAGEKLLLCGTMLTGRDAAHKRIKTLLDNNQPLPEAVNFNNKLIYYVGPVTATANEVVGPAGPTTATRMDQFTELMLAKTGLIGMVGKAERGSYAITSICQHKAVYLIAIGGAAYLVAKSIKAAKVIAFADLGMEAIYEFTVVDMPVTVAVDSKGQSIHQLGPAMWQKAACMHKFN